MTNYYILGAFGWKNWMPPCFVLDDKRFGVFVMDFNRKRTKSFVA